MPKNKKIDKELDKEQNKELDKYINIPIELISKADWNYKANSYYLLSKLRRSIMKNGQIENIIVRQLPNTDNADTYKYEVINGNHRLDILRELKIKDALCYNLGCISLNEAKRIAIETNETRFKTDDMIFSEVLNDINKEISSMDISETTSLDENEIDDFVSLFNFTQKDIGKKPCKKPKNTKNMVKVHIDQEVCECPFCKELMNVKEAISSFKK